MVSAIAAPNLRADVINDHGRQQQRHLETRGSDATATGNPTAAEGGVGQRGRRHSSAISIDSSNIRRRMAAPALSQPAIDKEKAFSRRQRSSVISISTPSTLLPHHHHGGGLHSLSLPIDVDFSYNQHHRQWPVQIYPPYFQPTTKIFASSHLAWRRSFSRKTGMN